MAAIWSSLLSGRMLIVFVMGFSSGMPLALVGNTLQAWMTDVGIELTLIGALALIKLPYALKFLWAPLLDRHALPFLGRRRGWLVVVQGALVLALLALSTVNLKDQIAFFGLLAVLVAFLSASQDILIDAYRREILEESQMSLGAAWAIAGYRIGFQFFAGALALYLADHIAWSSVYQLMAVTMAAMMGLTLVSPEPKKIEMRSLDFFETFTEPFLEFFRRNKTFSISLLAFILLYKIGDQLAANMTTPFILSLYSKTQYAFIGKSVGLAGTLLGGLVGGVLVSRLGMGRSLMLFGVFQAVSTLGFSVLAYVTPHPVALGGVIGVETLASGMGTAAYVGFMANLTSRSFTGTQYALLTSLMAVPSSLLSSPSGWIAQALDWPIFFIFCTFMALPGLVLAWILMKRGT